MKTIQTVDAYIASLDTEVGQKILTLSMLVKKTCPSVTEQISYGMPAYKYCCKPLIYFAAFTHHIGIYATPTAHEKFAKQLAGYKQGKGSVQIPLDQDLPLDLIRDMIMYNMREIEKKK